MVMRPVRRRYMKPFLIYAQSKDLQGYIKSLDDIDREKLIEINKRLLKMQLEVTETLEKVTS